MKYPGFESSTLEFKSALPQNDEIIKTIIGFCNQKGGKLIIGVNDSGIIVGISTEEVVYCIDVLSKAIYEASTPPILPLVYAQTIQDKTLLIIEVSIGNQKPYYKKSEGIEKGTYIRLGPTTLRATSELIEELKWQSRGRSYDTAPVYGTSCNDLDMEKIKLFLSMRRQEFPIYISQELLESYHLVSQEHVHDYASTTGILLFGKQPQSYFSEAMIICSHFKGNEGREAIASIDCTGTLFEQFEKAYDFILGRLSKSFTFEDTPRRKETLEIPQKAIREALLNMIIHRNYHQSSPSKIAIYQNRIEFFSPGTFFGPLNTQNLKEGLSFIRNTAICKIFREAGYIEKMGSGFVTIFKTYEERGLATPCIIEGEGFIKCILPRETLDKQDGNQDLQAILDLFYNVKEISILDVIGSLKISRSTAGRRLSALVDLGKLKKHGKGRRTSYVRL